MKTKEEVEKLHEKQLPGVGENIRFTSEEEAKNYLLAMVENDVKHESILMIKEAEAKAKYEG